MTDEDHVRTPAEDDNDVSRRAVLGLTAGGAAALAAGVGAGVYFAHQALGVGGGTGPRITVNGKPHDVVATPDTPLLYVLRNELGLKGPRFGCGLSQCGACTVEMGGTAVRSCVTPVSAVGSQTITTLEGLGTIDSPHPLQSAFIAEQAGQCAYCISGMIMEAHAYLQRQPFPTADDIKTALNGHLCRCGSHYRIIRAVQRAANQGGSNL